jgi:hypothetical protein
MTKKCPITNKKVIDDCHITIEFGYGSSKDLTTYTFSPVHDEVGKKVLESIQSMMQENEDIEKYGKNVMHEYFGEKWE